jgi:hypothetical protein
MAAIEAYGHAVDFVGDVYPSVPDSVREIQARIADCLAILAEAEKEADVQRNARLIEERLKFEALAELDGLKAEVERLRSALENPSVSTGTGGSHVGTNAAAGSIVGQAEQGSSAPEKVDHQVDAQDVAQIGRGRAPKGHVPRVGLDGMLSRASDICADAWGHIAALMAEIERLREVVEETQERMGAKILDAHAEIERLRRRREEQPL